MNIKNMTMIILAGGKSRRMGSPKENLLFNDTTFLETLKSLGESLGFSQVLVSGIDILDELPNRGPLGGMYTCLKSMKNNLAFILPVDCPNITKESILKIIDFHFLSHKVPTEMAVTLINQGDRLEPLIGVFSKDFEKIIYPCISNNSAPIMKALDQVPYKVYHHSLKDGLIINVNTKDDLKKL